MTEEQYSLLQRLKQCTFLPGSYDKRFVRNLSAAPKDVNLTKGQADYLSKLEHKYRRQLK